MSDALLTLDDLAAGGRRCAESAGLRPDCRGAAGGVARPCPHGPRKASGDEAEVARPEGRSRLRDSSGVARPRRTERA